VRGKVIVLTPHGFQHGVICGNVFHYVDTFVRASRLGRTLCSDAGIITEREPDTVRGADISYYSYGRVPQGTSPLGYAGASPEIVFEVVSPYNTRREVRTKTAEYLNAGVLAVCVVDRDHATVNVHYPELPTTTIRGDDELTFVELPGFGVPVSKLFA